MTKNTPRKCLSETIVTAHIPLTYIVRILISPHSVWVICYPIILRVEKRPGRHNGYRFQFENGLDPWIRRNTPRGTFGHRPLFLGSGRWTRFLTKESRLILPARIFFVHCLSLSKLFLWVHFFFFYERNHIFQEEKSNRRSVLVCIRSKYFHFAFVNDALICHLPRWR